MALNPPLTFGDVPVGIVGEVFCLERGGISLTLSNSNTKIKTDGKIYLTTLRICFVPSIRTASLSAIDIPLQGISCEDFKQPIFGANRLECVVAPVPGRGLSSPAKVSLAFAHGGYAIVICVPSPRSVTDTLPCRCGTFLHYFFRIMETYKMTVRDLLATLCWR